jgi:hypothetical protein
MAQYGRPSIAEIELLALTWSRRNVARRDNAPVTGERCARQ